MAIGFDRFVSEFPEFKRADRDLVIAKLAHAELMVDRVVWGAKADLGVMYLAATLLFAASQGVNARQTQSAIPADRFSARSDYERVYKALMMQVSSGYRVVGSSGGG